MNKKKEGKKTHKNQKPFIICNKIEDPLQKRFELLNIFSEEDIAKALKRKF